MEVEAVYKDGVLRLLAPVQIKNDKIVVRIVNRDEILTEENMRDIIEAMEERENGRYYRMEDVFE